jgi:hypothetical protein
MCTCLSLLLLNGTGTAAAAAVASPVTLRLLRFVSCPSTCRLLLVSPLQPERSRWCSLLAAAGRGINALSRSLGMSLMISDCKCLGRVKQRSSQHIRHEWHWHSTCGYQGVSDLP